MESGKIHTLILLFILISIMSCNSQDNTYKPKEQTEQETLINRQPVVAGRFYDSDPDKLRTNLKELFSDAEKNISENVLAIISPHAGYPCSGVVAATGFNQIDNNKEYENIFILASSHNIQFNGASIYNIGNYNTPLGTVKVNIPLAKKLVNKYNFFSYHPDAHRNEHSLEVQLPFLQYIMKKNFQIVPIVLGTQDPEMCNNISKALKPYFNSDNLFIISSDFSHYPAYEEAKVVDKATADAILSNSPDQLIEVIGKNSKRGVSDLSTSLCGWTSVMTLLCMTENNPDITVSQIQYKNSGETCGDRKSVVGYQSIVFSSGKPIKSAPQDEKEETFVLTDKDKKDLLRIARNTIEEYINNNNIPGIVTEGFSETLLTKCGAFVTLHKHGALRGCIGRFKPDDPLYKVIQNMAVSSSTRDKRFPKVTSKEIKDLEIEISVLTPMKKIESIDEIQLGKHGIYIKKGHMSGTFLPQVATDTKWTKEEFLGHCSRDKAGLGWEGWKNADVFIYKAIVFSEKDFERD